MSMPKLLAVVTVALALVGCETASKVQAPVPVPIVRGFEGQEPALKNPDVKLIKSKAELEAIKAQDLLAKNVDFSKEALVVVALGQRPTAGYWASITGVQASDGKVCVMGLVNKPGADEKTAAVMTYPYAAAVISKTEALGVCSQITSVTGQPKPAAPVVLPAPMPAKVEAKVEKPVAPAAKVETPKPAAPKVEVNKPGAPAKVEVAQPTKDVKVEVNKPGTPAKVEVAKPAEPTKPEPTK